MEKEKYLGRGIHKEKFLDSLTSGKLQPMLAAIKKDKDLDVQIRNDYLNIYYEGGNIAKVSSENSVSFDKNYFYTDKDKPIKYLDKEGKGNLALKKVDLIKKFKDRKYDSYFKEAKKVMADWFKDNPKEERQVQHRLSIENRYGNSDYTIIDLEYEVSIRSEFYCTFVPEGKSNRKKPRFDIIAVNSAGKLCVIELKKGTGALGNTSGLEEHYECYKHSIGRNHKPFMNEMKNLLRQKQRFGLIDKRLKILSNKPEFMFAYSYATSDKKKEDGIFKKYYEKLQKKPHVIKLNVGSWALKD